jgi:hypothetical protein
LPAFLQGKHRPISNSTTGYRSKRRCVTTRPRHIDDPLLERGRSKVTGEKIGKDRDDVIDLFKLLQRAHSSNAPRKVCDGLLHLCASAAHTQQTVRALS